MTEGKENGVTSYRAAPQSESPETPAARRRLSRAEWDVLLDAANAYEAEPSNFEDDPDDKRLEALRRAIRKIGGVAP